MKSQPYQRQNQMLACSLLEYMVMNSVSSKMPGIALARFAVAALVIAASFFLPPKLSTIPTLRARQNVRRGGSWLDRPLVNWNRKSRELPIPGLTIDQEDLQARCPNLLRQADSPHEREIVNAGWLLYGAVHSYGPTRVVTAMSGADGMCRPLGYQAFVYFGNIYGGTLSPVAMDSLTSGALTTIRLVSATNISAEFARYREQDSPCCPTRISYVSYEASSYDAPLVSPVDIVTKPLCPSETSVSENPSSNAARLFEVKWRVTEINGVALRTNNPYIRFERAAKIFSGNGGCNQIAGGFEIDGTNLTFLRVVSTRMACLDSEAQQLETDFVKALEQVTRFQLQGDVLRLYDCGSLLLVFQPDTSEVVRTPQEARVTGTVSYLQPIRLSQDAIVEVKLLDVSQADLPPVTIADQLVKPAGEEVPTAFELSYDPLRIEEDHRYVIQARILEGKEPAFISIAAYPVITGGHPKTANVILIPVPR